MTTALEGGEGSASRPGCFLPPRKIRYPLYRRLDGLQDRSGQVQKNSPPPGFDPWTFQPVASRYTDCATRPTVREITISKFGQPANYFKLFVVILLFCHDEWLCWISKCSWIHLNFKTTYHLWSPFHLFRRSTFDLLCFSQGPRRPSIWSFEDLTF
jgi:hypothetical protein